MNATMHEEIYEKMIIHKKCNQYNKSDKYFLSLKKEKSVSNI